MTEATATMARTLAMLSQVRPGWQDQSSSAQTKARPELRLDRDVDNRPRLTAA